jgi:hypothetical protein
MINEKINRLTLHLIRVIFNDIGIIIYIYTVCMYVVIA